MAVTIVGQASAAATSIAIPAHQAGDMILIFARGTAAAPTFPNAGGTVPSWQQVQSNFGFSLGTSVGTFVATAATTTSGTWTNALHMCVLVLRPGAGNKLQTDTSMIADQGANNTQTLIYPALVFQILSGSSFGVRCGMRNTAITAVGTPPAGWTNQSIQPAGAGALMAVHTRAAITVSPTQDTVTVTSSNSAFRCVTIEVQEVPLPLSVGVSGFGSAQAFGAPTTKVVLVRAVVGLGSAQGFGTPLTVKGGVARTVTGVPSAQAFGSGLGGAPQTVQVTGVSYQTATYTAITGQVICGTGWTVGSRTVSTQFGAPKVIYTPQTVIVPGVTRPPILYSITGGVICGDGHLVGWNNPLFGQPNIAWSQILPLPDGLGVPSAQRFGTPTGVGGPVTIPVLGLGSAQQFGKPLAYLVWFRPPQPPGEMLFPSVVCATIPLGPVECEEEGLVVSTEGDLVLTLSVEQ